MMEPGNGSNSDKFILTYRKSRAIALMIATLLIIQAVLFMTDQRSALVFTTGVALGFILPPNVFERILKRHKSIDNREEKL